MKKLAAGRVGTGRLSGTKISCAPEKGRGLAF